jgi:hypothetical protein
MIVAYDDGDNQEWSLMRLITIHTLMHLHNTNTNKQTHMYTTTNGNQSNADGDNKLVEWEALRYVRVVVNISCACNCVIPSLISSDNDSSVCDCFLTNVRNAVRYSMVLQLSSN